MSDDYAAPLAGRFLPRFGQPDDQNGNRKFESEGQALSTLLVGYDLNTPGKDYTDLIDKIKTYGAWWSHLDSTRLIKTAKTPTEVRDDLRALQDSNDEILVIDVSGDARAWAGFNESGSAWLKDTY